MGVASGFGYFLIALGPALTIFVTAIASKPFLILTLLASAIVWLVTLITASILWRAFLPGATWVFLPMLVTSVGVQEVVRPLIWKYYLKLENILNNLATKLHKPQLNFADRLQIALASGMGHGTAHAVFFGLSILAPAFGRATYYTQSCKQMPLFLVTALTTLGFFLLHTFSMIIAFNGYTKLNRTQQLFVPVMHLGASLLTLVNLVPSGCTAGVPMVLICAAATMAYSAKIVWDNLGPDSMSHGSLQRIQFATGL